MRARRFVGATLLEAVRRARQALGPDAVVVSAGPLAGRSWLRRPDDEGFEVVTLDDDGRLAEELTALRGVVEALERRLAGEPTAAQPVPVRLARVRISPERSEKREDPTPRSVDTWTRNSTSS